MFKTGTVILLLPRQKSQQMLAVLAVVQAQDAARSICFLDNFCPPEWVTLAEAM